MFELDFSGLKSAEKGLISLQIAKRRPLGAKQAAEKHDIFGEIGERQTAGAKQAAEKHILLE